MLFHKVNMIVEWDKDKRLDDIMTIWLDTNIEAHDFIDKKYWHNNFEMVKESLPKASIYLYMKDEEILGFIGIMERSYIAGLFVKKGFQNCGIGKKLLQHCKGIYDKLELDVYKKNKNAVLFYERNGFQIESEKLDGNNEIEYHMIWGKRRNYV